MPGGRNSLPLLAQWFGPVLAGLCLLHVVWWNTVRRWRRDGKLTPNIVIVGATDSARKLIETALKTREVAVLGVFDDRLGRAPKEIAGVPVLGDTGDLLGHKVLPYVDRIVIAVDPNAQTRVREIIARLRVLPNDVSLVLDSGGEDGRVRALSRIADAQLAQVSGEPADVRRAVVKRLQDITVGWAALILGLPVMALVALAIKLDSPGPIFFRQRRHGFNNEEILVWKFRSMRQEAADFAAVQQVQARRGPRRHAGRLRPAAGFPAAAAFSRPGKVRARRPASRAKPAAAAARCRRRRRCWATTPCRCEAVCAAASGPRRRSTASNES